MTASAPLAFTHYFGNLRDGRRPSRCDYRLIDVLFIAVCATIAGAEDWPRVAAFAELRRDWLQKFCRLPASGATPSHDTFERIFKRLDPDRFARCFGRWAAALAGLGLRHVAIDGKAARGSARRSAGERCLHLVSAWATDNHLSLGQVAVDEKSNEITALPRLLALLELKGALVTVDAMGCQKDVARRVVAAGGDYVLPVKGNQKGLLEDIERTFAYGLGMGLPADIFRADRHVEEAAGHGRRERRDVLVLSNLGLLRGRADWAGLSVIGRCERTREVAGVVTTEVSYFIGSRAGLGARGYADALRGHWGIENECHWHLDVTFGEDACRVADRAAAANLSAIRRHALALLKRHPKKASIANKRYRATIDTAFLEEVLQLGEPE
jgi:predicted transposase YbfD/YdcC